MANDNKKKSGFFGLFKKNKENTESMTSQTQTVAPVNEGYMGDIVLLTKKLDNTMEIPTQGIRNLGDGDFAETYHGESVNATSNVDVPEENVASAIDEIREDTNLKQESNQFESASIPVDEVKNESINSNHTPEPLEQNTPIFDFHAESNLTPEAESPSLNEFIQNETFNTNVSPNVDELIYNDQNTEGHSR